MLNFALSHKLISYIAKLLPVAAFITCTAASAQSLTLPALHESQHQDLLASQAPLIDQLKLENTQRFIQDIEAREALDDDELFNEFWDQQSVNPYGSSVIIPDHKVIDVSDYQHPIEGAVTSEFGWRPRFGRMHKGIDIALKVGDPVKAAFSGKVRIAKYNPGGYGYYVVIRHDNGLETVYGHLKRFTVKPGQRVKAGEVIGLGGNTGRSTGPHLHLETRYMGIAINPRAIIDFDNSTTHKDTYAFDRKSCEKAVNYAPARRSSKAKYAKSGKSKRKTSARRASSKSKRSKSKTRR